MKKIFVLISILSSNIIVCAGETLLLDSIVTEIYGSKSSVESYEYDAVSRETLDLTQTIDKSTGQYVPSEKTVTTYPQENQFIQRQFKWNVTRSYWEQTSEYSMEYDVKGRDSLMNKVSLIDTADEFDIYDFYETKYNYDNIGRVIQIITRYADHIENGFVYKSRVDYSYTDKDSIASIKQYTYSNNSWVGKQAVYYTYTDTLGRYCMKTMSIYDWNAGKKDFTTNKVFINYKYGEFGLTAKATYTQVLSQSILSQLEIFSYSSEGYLTEISVLTLNSTNTLSSSQKNIYEYDKRGNCIVEEIRIRTDNHWEGLTKIERLYNEKDSLIEQTRWSYDSESGSWIKSIHFSQTFDDEGNLLTYTTYSSSDDSLLAYLTYHYSNHNTEPILTKNGYTLSENIDIKKFIIDGQIMIRRGEKIYTVMGIEVK